MEIFTKKIKKIFAAVHEEVKKNKSIIEAAEKKITEKVESIRADFEAVLEISNSLSSLQAVSYTHLDVYKRQLLY